MEHRRHGPHHPLLLTSARRPRPRPDGGEMLRLWEWERLRDLPFQVDLWLPDGSDFLYAGVRVRNPHERPVPAYWWSNIAVPRTAASSPPPTTPTTSVTSGGCAGCPSRRTTAPTGRTRSAAPTPPTTSTTCPTAGAAGSPRSTPTGTGWCRPRPTCCAAGNCSSGAPGPAAAAGRSGSPSPAPAATARSRPASPAPSSNTWSWRRRARCPGWRPTGPCTHRRKGSGTPSSTEPRPGSRRRCPARPSRPPTGPG